MWVLEGIQDKPIFSFEWIDMKGILNSLYSFTSYVLLMNKTTAAQNDIRITVTFTEAATHTHLSRHISFLYVHLQNPQQDVFFSVGWKEHYFSIESCQGCLHCVTFYLLDLLFCSLNNIVNCALKRNWGDHLLITAEAEAIYWPPMHESLSKCIFCIHRHANTETIHPHLH